MQKVPSYDPTLIHNTFVMNRMMTDIQQWYRRCLQHSCRPKQLKKSSLIIDVRERKFQGNESFRVRKFPLLWFTCGMSYVVVWLYAACQARTVSCRRGEAELARCVYMYTDESFRSIHSICAWKPDDYNLRQRQHDLTLHVKTDDKNFLSRMICKDIY